MLRQFSKMVCAFPRNLSSVVSNKSDLNVIPLQGDDTGILVFSLNRPNFKNAFDVFLTANLLERLEEAKVVSDYRVVILKSDVRGVFSAGADLKQSFKFSDAAVNQSVSRLRFLANCIENFPLPVIAAVDGLALGGGLEMALACDIRVASDDSRMGLVESKLAIVAGAGGTQRLPRLVGRSLAKELIFTGRTFSGSEAYKMGVVNKCVKQNESGNAAYIQALDLAREILPNGPIGVRVAKEAINRGLEVDITTGCAIEEFCVAQVVPTQDRIEGLNAFFEKRPPRYVGK